MCLYGITAEFNGPLQADHVNIDDESYDLVECGAAGRPKLDLSFQFETASSLLRTPAV